MSPSNTLSVMVPLYIYPSPNAWTDLHESIEKNPNTQFWIIVNPGNGPGPNPEPDANYLREIPKLNSYSNVTVLGYVHVSFAARKLSDVLHDVETYSRWSTHVQRPGLSVQGIFVDETPNQFDVRAEKFLRDLTVYAKSCRGFGAGVTIVHNPGSVPSPAYMRLADITVIFEDTLQMFRDRLTQGLFDRRNLTIDHASETLGSEVDIRARCAVMIHSIPKIRDATVMQDIVGHVQKVAGHIFVTDLDTQYYQSFSGSWADWVNTISQCS